MTVPLPILQSGSCEPFKAGIHGAALGLVAIMGAYNAAAWLNRRERHLAVNALLYGLATFWEQRHVAHHIAACRRCAEQASAERAAAEQDFTSSRDKRAAGSPDEARAA
jgi:hypothetical protein